MATHCNILAWRIMWTEEPGGLLSMGLHSRTWMKRLGSSSSSSSSRHPTISPNLQLEFETGWSWREILQSFKFW